MASRLASYDIAGDAETGKALEAAALDLVISAAVALLLWPFPLIRLTLGLPWAIHVPLIVVWVLLVYVLYLAVCASLWGRTAVMYFLDLGLVPRPGVGRSLAWAIGWMLALLPSLLGSRSLPDPKEGLPARLSGIATRATTAAGEPR